MGAQKRMVIYLHIFLLFSARLLSPSSVFPRPTVVTEGGI